ncbi:MAG: tryptophan-rich sensory protein [Dehalococcoidia bacterium]|nr:tryptophan-rich sensory protein [Dehalococcoidia bacterium]MDD5647350.1 tryptophan-rich sensory protein [Dehalococcoidia bacterium]
MRDKRVSDIIKLLISLAACFGAGFIGSLFTRAAIPGWYVLLEKPSFTPPNWLFAPVWFLLYILMGISVFLVWRKGIKVFHVREGLIIFIIQLVLNTLWSYAFFGLKSPLWGLVVIVPLWTAILLTMINFYRVSRTASFLLIPYILWVSYATALNFSIYLLNP